MLSLGLLTFSIPEPDVFACHLAARPLPKTILGKAERMIMLENKRGSA